MEDSKVQIPEKLLDSTIDGAPNGATNGWPASIPSHSLKEVVDDTTRSSSVLKANGLPNGVENDDVNDAKSGDAGETVEATNKSESQDQNKNDTEATTGTPSAHPNSAIEYPSNWSQLVDMNIAEILRQLYRIDKKLDLLGRRITAKYDSSLVFAITGLIRL